MHCSNEASIHAALDITGDPHPSSKTKTLIDANDDGKKERNTHLVRKLRKSQLSGQSQSQLGMLKHVIKAKILYEVVRRMDVVV